ncbi:hypothetical protein EMIHUDRAFT_423073 [Emiliania huxleyi CCMP1516]|uniref:methionine synthase n=2 Tax=Emiliania huxleyi TaxID=2903 RepID=A0A0D3KTH9_EMIH1|nr:hypothetical protein EMIHUDRAFT_423073 [Emiliania huxleyi CCMP1516]EOD39064.1 hypothetical protein EMIHUDRAFT_423073 [Emiliania huxleyi CCMP1516]|eukprot:XP_005791493.1 hypothetical protein EMIHUDRAFT_423073 [Emiliania huxleyi CCMP1516]
MDSASLSAAVTAEIERQQAAINYDELSLDELKVVVASLVERLELAKAALTSKMDTPKLVAAKVEGTFPDLPWGSPVDAEMVRSYLEKNMQERIMVIDGAMGTTIQQYKFSEEDFRGERWKDIDQELKGNNDLLVFTQPDTIRDIHRRYFLAGADMVETNTFSGTTIAQADYKMEHIVYELNKVAAELAVDAAKEVTQLEPHKPRMVCGAIGPTNRTLSISPSVEDPGFRNCTWDEVVTAYKEQVAGLIDGGVHIILVETIFDTLNAKAALFAIDEYYEESGCPRLPVIISGTIVDMSGRTLSGQTTEAFYVSVQHSKPLCIGLNCALGAPQMLPFMQALAGVAECFVHSYPNAGLPNAMGGYDDTPQMFSDAVRQFAELGLVNMLGGCCGTTPEHIASLAQMLDREKFKPHVRNPLCDKMRLSGLEAITVDANLGYVNIGERCNIAGSAKFKKLILDGKYDKGLEIALAQAESGATVIDVNMDEGLLDGEYAMKKFLNMLIPEPDVSKLPICVDSSKFHIGVAGLKCCQGKCIFNSISLKEGEAAFIKNAKIVKRFGAAVVVMAFDEVGQAATYEDKCRICKRAYDILVGPEVEFPPHDIIFDPNILTIVAGVEEHNNYGKDFILATKYIKENLPGAHISGGVSNLSFGFRGLTALEAEYGFIVSQPALERARSQLLTALREAMHAIFLYHCIQNGMDFGIVNAGAMPIYEDIPQPMRQYCEEVVLNESADGGHVERLLKFAEEEKERKDAGGGKVVKKDAAEWRNKPIKERLTYSLVKGLSEFTDEDVEEARQLFATPLEQLHATSTLPFLEAEKTKRAAERAAAGLAEEEEQCGKGTVVLATVKGDVHDIGKNIVGVVLGCNNFKVIDCGVMQPCFNILEACRENKAQILGLSGLITPSLDEMVAVAKEMERLGMKIPLLIGGATTSKMHTAVKVAPMYSGVAMHVLDASRAVGVCSALLNPDQREEMVEDVNEQYEELREDHYASLASRKFKTLEEARELGLGVKWGKDATPPTPQLVGTKVYEDYPLEELLPYIDWNPFFQVWQLRGKYPNRGYPKIFNDETVGEEAKKLHADGEALIADIIKNKTLKARAVVGIWPANAVGDDIEVYAADGSGAVRGVLHTLRQQEEREDDHYLALSDFVATKESGVKDYVGGFAVSCGFGCEEVCSKLRAEGDDYQGIMMEAVADRLAEAFAELLHHKMRKELWGYAPDEALSADDMLKVKYQGIRPAPGYPTQPDHTEKAFLWELLDAEKATGITMTDSFAMLPAASVSAVIFANPCSTYFQVGKVCKDQITDYASRKGMSMEEAERWMGPYLAYDPAA